MKEFTLRSYLTTKALVNGAPLFLAIEAVASTALEHPEWDMDETRTWDEWESRGVRRAVANRRRS